MPDGKPLIVILDVRNGNVHANGENIDLPAEGRMSALHSIEIADVTVEVHEDAVLVKAGEDNCLVTMFTTKSESQMNAEKAARELHARTDKQVDDLEVGEHPVTEKFARVWDGSVRSGEPTKGGLKGF